MIHGQVGNYTLRPEAQIPYNVHSHADPQIPAPGTGQGSPFGTEGKNPGSFSRSRILLAASAWRFLFSLI